MIGAMILAAGRGERMRPLSDAKPKPLLEALVAPDRLADPLARPRGHHDDRDQRRAPCRAHDRRARRRALARRVDPLVARGRRARDAGGIATAMPLLPHGPALIVSGDIWTTYDYARLLPLAVDAARSLCAARPFRDGPEPVLPSEGRFHAGAAG